MPRILPNLLMVAFLASASALAGPAAPARVSLVEGGPALPMPGRATSAAAAEPRDAAAPQQIDLQRARIAVQRRELERQRALQHRRIEQMEEEKARAAALQRALEEQRNPQRGASEIRQQRARGAARQREPEERQSAERRALQMQWAHLEAQRQALQQQQAALQRALQRQRLVKARALLQQRAMEQRAAAGQAVQAPPCGHRGEPSCRQ